jgi:ribonucleotide reductase alpha subunit
VARSFYFVSSYEKSLFNGRYKNPSDEVEQTWEDVFKRVAGAVSKHQAVNGVDSDTISALEADFYDLMASGNGVPSSPQLWNYGTTRRFPFNGSSCFTGRMGDTLEDFRQADADAEAVYVSSGGFGVLLDTVRPRGCKIHHCSEGSMGSMCFGGPARRIEGTTGYITGSGRARGALMKQMGIRHPDCVEFIVAKRPRALGWLDDWPANVKAVVNGDYDSLLSLIHAYSSTYVFIKDWPNRAEVELNVGHDTLEMAINHGIIAIDHLGRAVPQVYDWNTLSFRAANRDWDLPLQNCNMSIRIPDEFMVAVENNSPWVLQWFSPMASKLGSNPWTKTDLQGKGLVEIEDGRTVKVTASGSYAELVDKLEAPNYRYGVVITTWEGLRANMSPNKNHWRDTDYARFYRTVVEPAIAKFHGPIMARQLWSLVNENAWNHADPGVVFESTYERFQPVDSSLYGPRLSNPCSEYVNSAGGSCNLISVNLRKIADSVDTSDLYKVDGWISQGLSTVDDWNSLEQSAEFRRYIADVGVIAKRCLKYINHAMDYNIAPVEYIHEMTRNHFRTVGVGIMGLAEAMMRFHVMYGSECGRRFAACTMSEVATACWEESFSMAKAGWVKPIGWEQKRMERIFGERHSFATDMGIGQRQVSKWKSILDRVMKGEYATNTCVTSVAPTGTISMIAGWVMTRAASNGTIEHRSVTSGIEPPFSWGVKRQDNSGEDATYHDLWWTKEHHGRPWMVTAMGGVTLEGHVTAQAAVCAFTCMSVSKTINVPEHATVDDVKKGYELAWRLGIPGTSLYRDNSKPMQVLSALECPSGECAIDKNADITAVP